MGKLVGEETDLGIQIVDTNTGYIPEDIDAGSLFLDDDDDVPPVLNPGNTGDDDGDGDGPGTDGNGGGEGGNSDGNQNGNNVPPVTHASSYKDSILSLAKRGIIAAIDEDTELETDKEGTVVKFKDVDIQNEEDYMSLVETLFEKKKEELLQGKEDLSGISDLTKKIIEIDKAGGNVSNVLNMKRQALDPIADLDLEKVDDQKLMVAHYLSLKYKDMTDDEIKDYVDLYESKGTLSSKAEACKKEIKEAMDKYMETQKQDIADQKARQEEADKKYRKDIKEKLGAFQLKDEYAKKIVDFAGRRNDKNQVPIIGKINDALKDPEQAAELALFLFDKEEYIRQKTNKAVKETVKVNFKRIAERTPKPGANKNVNTDGDGEEEGAIDLGKEKLIIRN